MTQGEFITRRERSAALRVGLFGLLGMGSIGNDACLESMLRYLRADHPDAILDAMCTGPERLKSHHGIDAVPLAWYQKYERQVSGTSAIALKVVGKGVDAFRTAAWVRRHDVVIVPGMGVLEATVPMRAVVDSVLNVLGLRIRENLRHESCAGQRGSKRHRQADLSA